MCISSGMFWTTSFEFLIFSSMFPCGACDLYLSYLSFLSFVTSIAKDSVLWSFLSVLDLTFFSFVGVALSYGCFIIDVFFDRNSLSRLASACLGVCKGGSVRSGKV